MVEIRRAKRGDVDAIVRLIADDMLGKCREQIGEPLAEEYVAAFDAIDRDPNQLLAVMLDGMTAIGTVQLTFIPGLSRTGAIRGQIEAVRIAADRRSEGFGEQLIDWAIRQCREHGCALVQLTTDRRRSKAHHFYEKLGFEPTHIGYKLEF